MKINTFSKIALLGCALSTAGLTALLAQDDSSASSSTTPPPHEGHHHGMLTSDERAELKKDREQVLSSNPDLKTEGETLHQQEKEHMDKVDAAIIAADPNAAPIIAKLKAEHHHHGPPPSDDSSDTSNQ